MFLKERRIEMKKILSVLLIVAVEVVFSFPVSFCDVCVAGKVKLSKTKLSMYVGGSTTIKVMGTKKKIKWSSSKKNVCAEVYA